MLVVLMVELADSVSIFEVLKHCGVHPADHLTAVQLLVRAKFDVTFKSAELKERFLPALDGDADIHIFYSGLRGERTCLTIAPGFHFCPISLALWLKLFH